MCFQLDGLPPLAQMEHATIETQLHMAESQSAKSAQFFQECTLDGEDTMGLACFPNPGQGNFLVTKSSHPAFFQQPWTDVHPPWRLFNPPVPTDFDTGLKMDNYAHSVGAQFGVRACNISDHSRSQSLLAASPDAQEFVVNRIAQHQRRLQAVLHPGLNMTFSSIQLEISDLMVPSAQPCSTDDLAQMPGTDLSPLQAFAFSVCSFVMGVTATFAVVRRTRATSADDYHQVA